MIDASAFLSVAGARAAINAPRRCATPTSPPWPPASRAAPRRWAAWSSCSPRVGPADADAAGVPLAHKDAFDTGLHAPRLAAASDGRARPAASVLRRLAGHGALNLGALAAEHACGATAENPHAPTLMNPLDSGGGRRLFQRLGGRGGGRPVPGLAGHGHRRLGPHAGRDLRPDRPEAHAGTLVRARRGPLAPTLDTVGVIARDALDAASVFAALPAGDEDPGCPCGWTRWSASWRVRAMAHRQCAACAGEDPTVAAALTGFEQRLRGAAALRATLPDLDRLNRLAQIVLHAEAALALAAAVRGPGHAGPVDPRHRAAGLGHAGRLVSPRAGAAAPLRALPGRQPGRRRPAAGALLPAGVPDRDAVTTSSPAFDPRALAALHRHHAYVNFLGLPRWCCRWAWTPVAPSARS